jgi:transposase-like protein
MAQHIEIQSLRGWSRKFTPEQIEAVLRDYKSGLYTGSQIQQKYGLGHNTLYRWVRRFKALPEPHDDVGYLRAEVARLKALVVELAMANKRLMDMSRD